MVHRPSAISAFEFVKISVLRARQLIHGCTPRVTAGDKAVTTAQREVAAGLVHSLPRPTD